MTDETPATAPTPKQLRELMGLLRDHGIVTDDSVYAYLGSVLGRDITSRKDATRIEMARVIAELHEHPYQAMTPERYAALRAPFPAEQVGKLPKGTCKECRTSQRKRCDRHDWISNCMHCGGSHSSATIHLDYVGHADLTDRLLAVDPQWTWRPFTQEEMLSLPQALRSEGLWIMLTVCGVTRPGFGDADGKSGGSAVKEAIGDALRNAGMRFGVALELWAKGDRDFGAHAAGDDDDALTDRIADRTPPHEDRTVDELDEMGRDELLLILDKLGAQSGKTWAEFTERWRGNLGGLSVDDLEGVPADVIAAQIRAVRSYVGRQA